MKPRGGEGHNGRLKRPIGFLVMVVSCISLMEIGRVPLIPAVMTSQCISFAKFI